ncbi:MAG TPA: hypothetical protein VJ873_01845 [bacterium]|nr:hypothetical protein [bacterium]
MIRKPLLCLFLAYALAASQNLWASAARVNALGGLSLVVEDETVDLNPFVLGNPAGLVLLPSKSRLDLAGEYFYENQSTASFHRTYAGSIDNLDTNTVNYQGLLFFPTDRWGVQLDGDYLYSEGSTNSGLGTQGNNRTRGLLRTAYDFGPFVLGAEFNPSQTTSPLAPQQTGGGAVVSGTDTTTALPVNAGLLACFPGDAGPKQDRFEIGGVYSNQLTPPKEEADLNVIPTSASTPSPVTATFSDTNAQVFGPEAYFEIPGSLQIAVLSRFAQFSTNLQETSPDTLLVPTPVNYKYDDGSIMALTGLFKSSSPLVKGLNLKLGGFLVYSNSNETFYDLGGSTTSTSTAQSLSAQVGAGVERFDDFTVGLQAALQNVTGANHNASGADTGDTGYLSYSLSLGGERWLSKHWAFRMGLVYQNQYNSGNVPYSTFFYGIAPGTRLINTVITTGAGFKDDGIYADWVFTFGQPTQDGGGPSAFATQLGTQLAFGVLFN